jgi:hypothetical protein
VRERASKRASAQATVSETEEPAIQAHSICGLGGTVTCRRHIVEIDVDPFVVFGTLACRLSPWCTTAEPKVLC